MYISSELQESVDYMGKVIDCGNKAGWSLDEPIELWVRRYEGGM
jgi:hypothetical protein